MKKVITYGTFDLLHVGHINILKRAKAQGDYLIVGLSTDSFNQMKHKDAVYSYQDRKRILEAIRYVDEVIPEESWEQKQKDIEEHAISTLIMGDDWRGEFDALNAYCEVIYLARTPEISTTLIKKGLSNN